MSRNKWFGLLIGLGIFDFYCAKVKGEGTLSQAGREMFQTNTRTGKVVWILSWTALSAWMYPHIIKWPKKIMDEIS